MEQLPIISIITVSYNAAASIENTIKSVLGQTYPAVEYIIIDGASKDGTQDVIKRYQNHIHYYISEKDKGIYDAMNKGMEAATGDYLLFLNADDQLFNNAVLENIFTKLPPADAYYGEVMLVDNNGEELGWRSALTPHKTPEKLSWKSLRLGMSVSHQAFIIKRNLAVTYNLQYQICADIDWMIRVLKNCNKIINTHLVISRFGIGGASKQQEQKAWKERFHIFSRHYGFFNNLINHLMISLRFLWRKISN